MDAAHVAAKWLAAWNRRDVDAVVSLYAPASSFLSPRAAEVTGSAEVHGRAALRSYWTAALERVGHLAFTPDRYLVDGDELVVVYEAERDGHRRRAAEFFRIGPDGLVTRGEAMYGAHR